MARNKIIDNFYDLEAWQEARGLVKGIYKMCELLPRTEIYGISSQLKRAVTSITANIAEGFARFFFRDKNRFYYQARASAAEVQSFIIIVRDLQMVDEKKCQELWAKTNEVKKLINGLIRSARKQSQKTKK